MSQEQTGSNASLGWFKSIAGLLIFAAVLFVVWGRGKDKPQAKDFSEAPLNKWYVALVQPSTPKEERAALLTKIQDLREDDFLELFLYGLPKSNRTQALDLIHFSLDLPEHTADDVFDALLSLAAKKEGQDKQLAMIKTGVIGELLVHSYLRLGGKGNPHQIGRGWVAALKDKFSYATVRPFMIEGLEKRDFQGGEDWDLAGLVDGYMGPETLNDILGWAGSTEVQFRRPAIYALMTNVELDPKRIKEELMRLLVREVDPHMRLHLVRWLPDELSGDELVVYQEQLWSLLDTTKHEVLRRELVRNLNPSLLPKARGTLQALSQEDLSPMVRNAATEVLKSRGAGLPALYDALDLQMGDAQTLRGVADEIQSRITGKTFKGRADVHIKALEVRLPQDDPYINRALGVSLVALGSKQGLPAVVLAFEKGGALTRTRCLEDLAAYPKNLTLGMIKKGLLSDDVAVITAGIKAAVTLGKPSTPYLYELLNHTGEARKWSTGLGAGSDRVCDLAAKALWEITKNTQAGAPSYAPSREEQDAYVALWRALQ